MSLSMYQASVPVLLRNLKNLSAVLAKAGLTLPDGDAKLEVQAIDAALSKLNLPTDKRIQLKNELHRVGAL